MTELRLDDAGAVSLRADQIAGVSLAVLGITGSGKTNSVAVIAEELLACQVPMTFLDLESEFWTLKQRFQVLVVGRSDHSDVDIGPEHAADLARMAVERGLTIVLDFSEHEEEEEIEAFLLPYLKALWVACTRAKRPYVVVVEEAHEFVPQSGKTPLKKWLIRIASRGRKRGLSLIFSSQRSALVDKSALSQCWLRILHHVEVANDLEVYKTLIPWQAREVEQRVVALRRGEAIVVIEGQQAQTVRMRARSTFHPSATPTVESAEPALQAVDAVLLDELRQMLVTPNPTYLSRDERARLQQRIKELEAEKQRLEEEVERLSAQAAAQNHQVPLMGASTYASQIEIEQATVGRVILSGHASEALASVPTSVALLPAPEIQREGEAPTLTRDERRQLTTLTNLIAKQSRLHRRLLRVLSDHEGEWLDMDQIAAWIPVQPSTLKNEPPHKLREMKLIARRRGTGGVYVYTSLLGNYLQGHFPRLDTAFVKAQVLAPCYKEQ